MNILVMTPVRLLGDGLVACFSGRANVESVAVVGDLGSLRRVLSTSAMQVVLVDVSQGIELFDVRDIVVEWPLIPLVALGLNEQRQDVIRCGRAGFAGYVPRDASIDELCATVADVIEGRLCCPPEISGSLLRALFSKDPATEEGEIELGLTRRETEVLELLGRGLSNKEIGDELCLSVATVKHHVHHVLEKLKLPRRAQAMRKVRESPWLARSATVGQKK